MNVAFICFDIENNLHWFKRGHATAVRNAHGHGLVSQTIETMANIRDPAPEIVNNVNRNKFFLLDQFAPKMDSKLY